MLIECSAKLFRGFGYRTLRPTASYAERFTWVATGFIDDEYDQWILLANIATGFCVVTREDPDPDEIAALSRLYEKYDDEIILSAMRAAFLREGFDEALIESYLTEGAVITMKSGASAQSMMNRLSRWKKLFEESEEDFTDLASSLSSKAIRIDGNKIVPVEAMKAALESKDSEIAAEMIPMVKMKITLRLPAPYKVYRDLEVPVTASLGKLHEIIQAAFEWDNAHLHEFKAGSYTIGPEEDEADSMFSFFREEPINEDEITVGEIAQSFKQFTYIYDFGDYWEHLITFKKGILRPVGSEVTCTGGKGDTPWEDCGGPGGYMYMMEVLEDPTNAEYEEIKEWTEGDLIPRFFTKEGTNVMLKGILSRPKLSRFF